MILRAVECRGYKAFRQPTRLALRKITVLFGKNNSGKTTLARLPIFAAASFANRDSLWALSHSGLRFGSSFADLASADQPHPQISLGLEWTRSNRISIDLQNVTTQVSQDSVQPTRLKLDKDVDVHLGLKSRPTASTYGLISEALSNEQQARLLDRSEAAQELLSGIIHIPSMRPKIDITYTAHVSDALNVEEVPYLLSSRRSLLSRVDRWFREAFDGASIAVDQAAFAFQLAEARSKGPSVNLAESGRGIQSALPIVVLLLGLAEAKRKGSFVVIEEPEAHLHPSAHGAMADLVIACASQSQIVIETHSENFILRLRRRIAEGRLSHRALGLFYIDASHEIQPVPIDQSGGTDHWPSGVFESDIDEAQAIVEAKLSAIGGLGEPSDT